MTRGPGALETWKCKRCGTEETAHVYYPNRPAPPDAGEPRYVLTVVLPQSITAKQVLTLRRIFRKFELMSPVAVKRAAAAKEVIDLGEYPQSAADAHARELEAMGMSLGRKPVASR